jgi:alpha-D-ribose 1-methylphosphonate 5-triphosphate diphosphatase PhnM
LPAGRKASNGPFLVVGQSELDVLRSQPEHFGHLADEFPDSCDCVNADDDILSLPQAVACVTRNAALSCGLPDRGDIKQGLRADLIQVKLVNLPQGGRQPIVRVAWREGQRVI